jgi:O-antigen ligase
MKGKFSTLLQNPIELAQYILPLTAALMICRAFPILSFFYYAVPFLLLLILALYLTHTLNLPKRLKLLLLLIILFGAWAAITAFWSPYPDVTLKRAGYFLLISIPTVMLGYFWRQNEKNDLFGYLLPANIIVVTVSIYSLITSSPENAWTGGHGLGFMGYAGHQNILAAAIIFTIPSVLAPLASSLSRRNEMKPGLSPLTSNISRLTSHVSPSSFNFSPLTFYLLLLFLNLLLLALTYSRASMMSLAAGILVFLFLIKAYKILSVVFTFAAVVIILSLTVQPINNSISSLLRKDGGELLSRRLVLWEPSWEAAEMGGLFGLGYGISAQGIKTPKLTGSHYENGRYIREKGNSVFALAEEVGIVGLFLFLSIVGYAAYLIFKSSRPVTLSLSKGIHPFNHPVSAERTGDGSSIHPLKLRTVLLLSVLAVFFIHAQFEGWWAGVGSVHLPLLFIILGQAFTRK